MERIKYLIARELNNLKQLTPKERIVYLWDYYKISVVVFTLVFALGIAGIFYYFSSGATSLYVVLVNAQETESTVFSELLDANSSGSEQNIVEVEGSYKLQTGASENADVTTVQVLAALFSIGDMDIFAANEDVFQRYASQGGFEDLEPFLSEDLLTVHTDDLYYTDVNGVQMLSGIWLREGSPLHTVGYYTDDVVLGIAANAGNFDNALCIVKSMLEKIG